MATASLNMLNESPPDCAASVSECLDKLPNTMERYYDRKMSALLRRFAPNSRPSIQKLISILSFAHNPDSLGPFELCYFLNEKSWNETRLFREVDTGILSAILEWMQHSQITTISARDPALFHYLTMNGVHDAKPYRLSKVETRLYMLERTAQLLIQANPFTQRSIRPESHAAPGNDDTRFLLSYCIDNFFYCVTSVRGMLSDQSHVQRLDRALTSLVQNVEITSRSLEQESSDGSSLPYESLDEVLAPGTHYPCGSTKDPTASSPRPARGIPDVDRESGAQDCAALRLSKFPAEDTIISNLAELIIKLRDQHIANWLNSEDVDDSVYRYRCAWLCDLCVSTR
jgi:hypothetical protein